jgi:F-type H+-transporting ATPase subunit b
MRFDLWTMALQTVNVLILIWLLQRFLFKPVLGLIARRRDEIEQSFEEAEEEMAKARGAEQRFEEQRQDLAKRSDEILQQSHAKARDAYNETIEKGRQEAAQFLEAERRRIEDERRDALIELRDKAVELSIDLAGRLLGELDPATVSQAFLASIERHLRTMAADELSELRRQTEQGGTLLVVSALALDDTERQRWKEALVGILGGKTRIRFETDDDLIAGAELHFPNAVLRFSWRDKLAAARKSLAREDESDADTAAGT